MVEDSPRDKRTLDVAQHVVAVLKAHDVDSAVIGGMALAAHNYPRGTADFDLATDTEPFTTLKAVADKLRQDGYAVEFCEPEAGDPLGGALRITGDDFDQVHVVNYRNPYSRTSLVGREAIKNAIPFPNTGFRIVDLPHLIALKLYAALQGSGGKARQDIIELLERNPGIDMDRLRQVCASLHLERPLDAILADMRGPS